MNFFKKSEIFDFVDIGMYVICNKVCLFDEVEKILLFLFINDCKEEVMLVLFKVLKFKVVLDVMYRIF